MESSEKKTKYSPLHHPLQQTPPIRHIRRVKSSDSTDMNNAADGSFFGNVLIDHTEKSITTTTTTTCTLDKKHPLDHTSNRQQQQQQEQQNKNKRTRHEDAEQFLMGLTLAGVTSGVLSNMFRLFHVDVFLAVYELPLSSFKMGNMVFAVVNTTTTVLGAWMLDSWSTKRNRSDMLGRSGLGLAMAFVTPFFQWQKYFSKHAYHYHIHRPQQHRLSLFKSILSSPSWLSVHWWNTAHFIISTSLYDTFYSFNTILLGSLVTDNHNMADSERVWFMASGKMATLVAAIPAAKIGLHLFDDGHDDDDKTHHLQAFQSYIVVLAILAVGLFVLSQLMMQYTIDWYHLQLRPLNPTQQELQMQQQQQSQAVTIHHKNHSPSYAETIFKSGFFGRIIKKNNNNTNNYPKQEQQQQQHQQPQQPARSRRRWKRPAPHKKRQLRLRRVLQDFWNHHNFWAWVGMELFLESQVSFANAFMKTFVDRLVFGHAYSREQCDWLLSMLSPLGQLAGILCYIPMRQFGYRRVYPILFAMNAVLCLLMLLLADHHSTRMIIAFLVIYPTLTVAVSSAGFHLVMSDMVLEMKKMHALQGRWDEPSLAGLFMGMNALFCKPAESILPVLAASMLSDLDMTVTTTSSNHSNNGTIVFVGPHHPDSVIGDNNSLGVVVVDDASRVSSVLFQVLVLPPLVFSILEWLSWRRYSLTPQKTSQMREELRRIRSSLMVEDDLHIV